MSDDINNARYDALETTVDFERFHLTDGDLDGS